MDKKTLEEIVKRKSALCSTVYFLSEVGYDTDFFDGERAKTAYENILTFMANDPELEGIVLDGVLTRLDRPEILSSDLTYWDKTEEECMKATNDIPNREQYRFMRDGQFRKLDERLGELRERVTPDKDIYLSIETDDLQFTVSAMLNELLLHKQNTIDMKIEELKETKSSKRDEVTAFKKSIKTYEGKIRKSTKPTSNEVIELKNEVKKLKARIKTRQGQVHKLDENIQKHSDKKKLYREKKVRPAHQNITKMFMEELYSEYEAICQKHDIKLVKKQGILQIGNLTIDYAHSRHSTWTPMKRRDSALLSSTHGKMTEYQSSVLQELKEAATRGVDAIVESGHSGNGYKQLQKTKDIPAETNFENQSSFDPEIGDNYITPVIVLPFEDQVAISEFMSGEEPIRLSGGKPINTRKHAVFDRMKNGGVSGLTFIRKNEEGILGTGWVQYHSFVDGSLLNEPDEYYASTATSDEHVGSPEENWTVRNGIWVIHEKTLEEPSVFRGKPLYTKGFISGGDTSEANSRRWQHRNHHKVNPQKVMDEVMRQASKIDTNNPEDVKKLALQAASYARSGSVENMAINLDWTADYYEGFLNPTIRSSKLKHAFIATTGNHADGVLVDLGLREADFFRQRLKGRNMPVYQVGEPLNEEVERARVFLGGYSNARVINIKNYGVDTDGNPMFGPINLLLQHDPKGSGFGGLIGAGRSVEADVALAGHTHENWVKCYPIANNKFRIAYRMATLQGVSPTEKYYAKSVPRTQAGHRMVMPQPGFFYEEALPASYLRKKGQEDLDMKVKGVIENNKK